MPTVELNGTTLFYELAGDGEPLVLLNGIMMTTQSWVLQKRVLMDRFRLVMHDFRGQMRSAKPPGPYRLQTHVDDLEALLDHLGIERAFVAGTSYGGEIGLMFASQHPERVRKLAVIASVSEVGPDLIEKVDQWARTARSATPEEFYDTTVPYNYSPQFRATQPEMLEVGRQRIGQLPPEFFRAFADLVDAFRQLDVTKDLPKITAPTLVIGAAGDILKPLPYSRLIAERIPNAELRIVPGGHAAVIESADEVNAALLEFFF